MQMKYDLLLDYVGIIKKNIKDFAKIAKCLHKLTEKGRPFVWSNECQDVFDMLKQKLISFLVIGHPDFLRSSSLIQMQAKIL